MHGRPHPRRFLDRFAGRLATAAAVTSVASLALFATALPAVAAPPHPQPAKGVTITGPFPVPEPPISFAAGDVCTFPLRISPTLNRTKVLRYTNQGGRVTQEFYYGRLLAIATNTTTGTVVKLDLSAYGLFVYAPDAKTTIYGYGPYGLSLHRGDHPGPFFAVPYGNSKVSSRRAGSRPSCTPRRSRTSATSWPRSPPGPPPSGYGRPSAR